MISIDDFDCAEYCPAFDALLALGNLLKQAAEERERLKGSILEEWMDDVFIYDGAKAVAKEVDEAIERAEEYIFKTAVNAGWFEEE